MTYLTTIARLWRATDSDSAPSGAAGHRVSTAEFAAMCSALGIPCFPVEPPATRHLDLRGPKPRTTGPEGSGA